MERNPSDEPGDYTFWKEDSTADPTAADRAGARVLRRTVDRQTGLETADAAFKRYEELGLGDLVPQRYEHREAGGEPSSSPAEQEFYAAAAEHFENDDALNSVEDNGASQLRRQRGAEG
jgi:hypothetical protein